MYRCADARSYLARMRYVFASKIVPLVGPGFMFG